MRHRAITATLAVLLLTSGCGYRLAGTNSFLPERIRIIAVLPFENRTTRTEIDQRVTEEVTRELSRRGRYRVVVRREGADALLQGAVTTYRTVPVQFNPDGRASRVEAVVTLQATLRDLSDDTVLWSQDGLIFREQFVVPAGGEFFDDESVAIEDIARGAAGALITSILEGF
jgi:TolB-like protein